MSSNMQLQKEQYQLLKISKEIESILGKVNEAMNALKVEELTLKSAVLDETASVPQSSDTANREITISSYWASAAAKDHPAEDEFNVNRQEIILDMFLNNTDVEEEDSD